MVSFEKFDVFADESVDYFSTNIKIGFGIVERFNALGGISYYEN
jgi:hypothetical protein